MANHVGVIGLGTMGGAIAGHLLDARFPVWGYDVFPARVRELSARGGSATSTVAELVANADVILTSLPSEQALDDVVAEAVQQLQRAPSRPLVVETSTLTLDSKLAARDRLEARGASVLDSPLSGTGLQARSKDLAVYVSGDDEASKAEAAAVLDGFCRVRYDVGPFGNGSKMKFVANLLVAVHNLAAAEALALADRAGLDLDLVLRAVGDGAGSSRMLQVRGPTMTHGNYAGQSGMRVDTFEKDRRIIADFASSVQSPTPLFAASGPFYEAAIANGWGDKDTACLYELLRSRSR